MSSSGPDTRHGLNGFRLCAASIGVLALFPLVGWLIHHTILASLRSGWIPVAPNTAACFLVFTIGFGTLTGWPHPRWTRATRLSALVVGCIALLRTLEYVTPLRLHVDAWLINTSAGYLGQMPTGKMALSTALGLLLLACALFFGTFPASRAAMWAEAAAASGGFGLGLVFLLGYTYGAPLLYNGSTIPMAAMTATSMALGGLGLAAEVAERLTREQQHFRTAIGALNAKLAGQVASLEQLNAELDQHRSDLSSLVERNHEGIAVVNQQAVTSFANAAACRLLDEQALEERPFPLELPAQGSCEVQRGARFLQVHLEQIDWRGRPATLVALRDVSARHRTEQALQESRDQLNQAQKMEAVGRLAGGVAHDFNNLLTAILGYCELLREETELAPEPAGHLAEIQADAQRARDLTSQLLAFSRRRPWSMESHDLNALVRNLYRMLTRLLGEDLQLVLDCCQGQLPVDVDAIRVEQVVVNLVINARDATPAGGTITIRTAAVSLGQGQDPELQPGRYSVLEVSDTGIGIDEEVMEHLFEPFFTTKELGHGTGLGLSTVYATVEQLRGSIRVRSNYGEGATFTIYLPRGELPGEPSARNDQKPVGGELGTVLLVEDEDSLRRLLRTVLARHGYQVLAADSPAEAERLFDLADGPIGVLVSDIVMPGGSGEELARRLSRRQPQLQVLLMSGYSESSQAGAEYEFPFLAKPFTPTDLIRKLDSLSKKA